MGRVCPYDPLDGIWQRLKSAGKPEARTHYRDLLALTRHWVRAHMLRDPVLCPGEGLTSDWFSEVPETAWAEHGLRAEPAGDGKLLVVADAWRPPWLRGADVTEPGAAAVRGDRRRSDRPVCGDPYLRRLGKTDYRSASQRAAMHAVSLAPPRSTLAVGLPTGEGKSLCAELWPFAPTPLEIGRTALVVVPTVALALDQERSLISEGLVPHRTAWVSDMKPEDRRAVVQRLLDGSQGIIHASPEAVLGSLTPHLFVAAKENRLGDLVIDEAHIVAQWGEGFRPEFQQLAGLRNRLLDDFPRLPMRTLGLSATFTQEALDIFRALFGSPGPFGATVSGSIRPEPEYWAHRCSEAERSERVMEAIHHLPRPLILYVTKVEDAQSWLDRLSDAGYKRLRQFTGETRTKERREIVDGWSGGRLDIVVGTSAFGLGVDVQHIRSVVHACVPESLDRYYQEVGRAGRDGAATAALALHTPADRKCAGHMARQSELTIETGLKRWDALWHSAKEVDAGSDLYRVDLDPARVGLTGSAGNQLNREWNVRTLTLMARAELLRLYADGPANSGGGDADRSVANSTVVQILDQEHGQQHRWEEAVEPVRSSSAGRKRASLAALERLLRGHACAGTLLAAEYALQDPRTQLSASCGGCAACRNNSQEPYVRPATPPRHPWPREAPSACAIIDLLPPAGWVRWVALPSAGTDSAGRLLVEWAAAGGVPCACLCDRDLLEGSEAVEERRMLLFGATRKDVRQLPAPAVLLHAPTQTDWARSLVGGRRPSVPLIVAFPEDAPDPAVPTRLLSDCVDSVCWSWAEFTERVGMA